MGAKRLEWQRSSLCRAATGYCSKNKKKTGEISAKTGRWNHDYVVGKLAAKAVKGPAIIIGLTLWQ